MCAWRKKVNVKIYNKQKKSNQKYVFKKKL